MFLSIIFVVLVFILEVRCGHEIEIKLPPGAHVKIGWQWDLFSKKFIRTPITGKMPTAEAVEQLMVPNLVVETYIYSAVKDKERFRSSSWAFQFFTQVGAALGLSDGESEGRKESSISSTVIMVVHGNTTSKIQTNYCDGWKDFEPPQETGQFIVTSVRDGVLIFILMQCTFASEEARKLWENNVLFNVPVKIGSLGFSYSNTQGDVGRISNNSLKVQILGDVPMFANLATISASDIPKFFESLKGFNGVPKFATLAEIGHIFRTCPNNHPNFTNQSHILSRFVDANLLCDAKVELLTNLQHEMSPLLNCFPQTRLSDLENEHRQLSEHCSVVHTLSNTILKNRFTQDINLLSMRLRDVLQTKQPHSLKYYEKLQTAVNFASKARARGIGCEWYNDGIRNINYRSGYFVLFADIEKLVGETTDFQLNQLANATYSQNDTAKGAIVFFNSTSQKMSTRLSGKIKKIALSDNIESVFTIDLYKLLSKFSIVFKSK